MNGEPLLETASHGGSAGGAAGGRLALCAAGTWTAERAGELERLIERVIARHPQVDGVDIDMQRVERLDTFGAWLLERLLRGLGAFNRNGSNLISYLLFEKPYCRELINLGYQDAMRRKEEILRFLETSSV